MMKTGLNLLRSVDDPECDLQQLQADLHEYLSSSKDKELISQLLLTCFQFKSSRAVSLLAGLKDPYNKWLLERCGDNLRQNESTIRMATLKLLLCIVQRDPPWLHDTHPRILKETLTVLKEGSDVTACFISVVIMATILPLIPGAFDKRTLESSMFRGFCFAAELCVKRKEEMAELNRQHLCSGLYTFYKVLYSMFPCNFLAFLRTTYGTSDNPEYKIAWRQIIWPMVKRTYFHPFLVQYNCDSETHKDRWKGQQKHDIIADCQIYFADQRNDIFTEPIRPKLPASKPCSIPKKETCMRNIPSSDGILGKTPNLLDVMATHPSSDISSSLGSVDIAEEANPEESTSRSSDFPTPPKNRTRRRSSTNLPPIPAEPEKDKEILENSVFCSTTQRLTQEPTNSISEHPQVQDDPPPDSEMENLLASGLRNRHASQCQVSSPQGSPHFNKLMRSMSCPSAHLSSPIEDSALLSETASSSNEDLSSKCLSLSLWPNSPEPRRGKDNDGIDEKTPSEILEDHMKACASLVLRENEYNQSCGQGNRDQCSFEDLQKELAYTKAHSTMLYVELLYDRHRKEIHIERNRRLLEKAKRIIQLEEKNTAMSVQAREIQEELVASSAKITELQRLLEAKNRDMETEMTSFFLKTKQQDDENRRLLIENKDATLKNTDQSGKLEEAKAQLYLLESELHEAKLKWEAERMKSEELISYKEKSARLEQELISIQEMYQRLEEIYRSSAHDCGQIFNKDELAKELKQCKARLEHRKQESDAASERYRAQQAKVDETEKALKETRKHLSQLEVNTMEQLKAKDEHIIALKRSQEKLHFCILQLQSKIDEIAAVDDEREKLRLESSEGDSVKEEKFLDEN